MDNRRIHVVLSFLLALTIAGCASTDEADAPYKKARTIKPLEVPPDLTEPEGDSQMVVPELSAINYLPGYRKPDLRVETEGKSLPVLPEQTDVRLGKDGALRWLVVNGTPEQVWPHVVNFWTGNGILLTLVNPEIGIMETAWVEFPLAGRDDVQDKSAIEGASSVMMRERFRVRLEKGNKEGTTEIYISHYRMEQVLTHNELLWRRTDTDPEVGVELLRRMMMALKIKENQASRLLRQQEDEAEATARVITDLDGKYVLLVEQNVDDLWRRTGLAMERMGLVIEGQDAKKDVYYFSGGEELLHKYQEELKGNGKLASRDRKYKILLNGDDKVTQFTMLDMDNHAPDELVVQAVFSELQAFLQ